MANIPFSAAADMNTIKVNELGQLYTESQVNLYANPWDCFGTIVEQWDISNAQDGSYLVSLYDSGLLLFAGLGECSCDQMIDNQTGGLIWSAKKDNIHFVHMLNSLQLKEDYVNLDQMFAGCTALESVGNLTFDISCQADVNLNQMFADCTALESVGNLTFDISCQANVSLNQMFASCAALESVGNLTFDISCQDTVNLNEMFASCAALESVGNLTFDISCQADVNLTAMFAGCTALESIGAISFRGDPYNEKWGLAQYRLDAFFSGCSNLCNFAAGFNLTSERINDASEIFDGLAYNRGSTVFLNTYDYAHAEDTGLSWLFKNYGIQVARG